MSVLLGLLLAALLPLQQRASSNASPPAPRVPPTRMGVELLATCPLVIVGRTIAAKPAGPGIELLHIRIIERLVGPGREPGEVVTVLSPVGQFPFGSQDLLFLKPWRGDERFEVARRIDGSEPNFEAKLALTRRMVWLMEIVDDQARIDATLSLVLGQLAGNDAWSRSQGLDELRWMSERLPGMFTASRRGRLIALGRISTDPRVVEAVESALRRLRATDNGLRETAAKEQSPP